MAGLGLGGVVYANDFDERKADSYRANCGPIDVRDVAEADPPDADVWWASPPCQDLSIAGHGAGLDGSRSRAFFTFADLVQRRRPRVVVIENVTRLLGYLDRVQEALDGYTLSHTVLDAADWLPQSRPRVIIVAADRAIDMTVAAPGSRVGLEDLIDEEGDWFSEASTAKLVQLMAPVHRARFEAGGLCMAFRRGRGVELRDDGLAGCLRTPSGGSSKQLVVRDGRIRWLKPREAARLMGLPEHYVLPENNIQALKLCGDGVAVPMVWAVREQVLSQLF